MEDKEKTMQIDPVKEAVLKVFNDPRYREQWSEAEILTRLLSALDPWYPYKGLREKE